LENITSVSICEATHHPKKDRHLLCEECPNEVRHLKAITAIKVALEAKDEPVAWMDASRFEELRNGFTVMTTLTKKKAFFDDIAIYTTPPPVAEPHKRLSRSDIKPLTDEEIEELHTDLLLSGKAVWFPNLARAIEAKLRSKNGY
jgi:hypothetical protein